MSEQQYDIPKTYADREAEIVRLNDELALLKNAQTQEPEATAPATTSTIGAASPPPSSTTVEADPNAQTDAVHALAPGTAGPEVAQLAGLVEQAGEKTYLSDPDVQNGAHVFTDELLAAVKRILHNHPEIAAVVDEAERQRLNRWIGGLHVVTGEVWKLIAEVADQKKAAA